jgi:hypothetical protein
MLLAALIAAAVALIFESCAKPPVEEMTRATEAVARAENDPDVIAHAASTLARAREALINMQTEADAKRYDEAKRYAADAQQFAEKAIADAKNSIARQKEDAANAINAMNNALASTDELLQNAHASDGRGLDLPRLDSDFAAARTTAESATTANNEARYREAIDRSQEARSALSAISTEISQAVIAVNRKK